MITQQQNQVSTEVTEDHKSVNWEAVHWSSCSGCIAELPLQQPDRPASFSRKEQEHDTRHTLRIQSMQWPGTGDAHLFSLSAQAGACPHRSPLVGPKCSAMAG